MFWGKPSRCKHLYMSSLLTDNKNLQTSLVMKVPAILIFKIKFTHFRNKPKMAYSRDLPKMARHHYGIID